MNGDALLSLYRYNAWANATVLDIAAELAEADFVRPSGPSHGTIRNLLLYMWATEAFFLAACAARDFKPPFPPTDLPALSELRRHWTGLTQEAQAFVGGLSDSHLAKVITVQIENAPLRLPMWQYLYQAFHQSVQHRVELSVVLTQLGHPLPNMDVIIHFVEQSGQTWPGK